MRIALHLAAAIVATIIGACAIPPDGYCSGSQCLCEGTNDCILDCPASGCVSECASVSNCDSKCGDLCTLMCKDTSNCVLECGDGCAAECSSVSNCDVECGADCAVDCNNLSNCNVTMISGEVMCQGVSNCNVRCALPDGGNEPASDCGGGRYSCPAGSC